MSDKSIDQRLIELELKQAITEERWGTIDNKLDRIIENNEAMERKYVRADFCQLKHDSHKQDTDSLGLKLRDLEDKIEEHIKEGNKRNSNFIYYLITAFASGLIGILISHLSKAAK